MINESSLVDSLGKSHPYFLVNYWLHSSKFAFSVPFFRDQQENLVQPEVSDPKEQSENEVDQVLLERRESEERPEVQEDPVHLAIQDDKVKPEHPVLEVKPDPQEHQVSLDPLVMLDVQDRLELKETLDLPERRDLMESKDPE